MKRSFVFMILIVFCSRLPAAAPEISTTVGFGNRFRPGGFTSVSVAVTVPDTVFEGELVLEYTSGNALERGSSYRISRQIQLSAQIPGTFRFTLPLQVSSYPLVVRLERNGLPMAEEEILLRPLISDRPLVVGISRRPSLDFLIRPLGERYDRSVEITYPSPETLPLHPRAWSGIKTVVWHDLSPEILDNDAAQALVSWIASGGEFFVVPGPWLINRPFPAILPIPEVLGPDSNGDFFLQGLGKGDRGIVEISHGKGHIYFLSQGLSSSGSGTFESFLKTLPMPEIAGPDHGVEDVVFRSLFDEEGPVISSMRFSVLIGVLFALAASGIMVLGLKNSEGRLRIAIFVSVLLLGVIASAIGIIRSPARSVKTKKAARILLFDSQTLNWEISRTRFLSSRYDTVNLGLPSGSATVREDGGDLELHFGNAESGVRNLSLTPWTPVEIGTVRPNTDDISANGFIRIQNGSYELPQNADPAFRIVVEDLAESFPDRRFRVANLGNEPNGIPTIALIFEDSP